MIEIDLLPQDLSKRKKEKKGALPALPTKKTVVFVIFGAAGLLIFINLFLLVFVLIKQGQYKNFNNQWPQYASDKEKIDRLRKELVNLESNVTTIGKLTTNRILWSRKIQTISDLMPKGIWITFLSVASNKFSLQGSAVSKKLEEMALISKFLTDLKTNSDFSKDIKNLELGPVQRRLFKGWEIVDFIFVGDVKE
jgi:Tfp pilus assembly protein PilN